MARIDEIRQALGPRVNEAQYPSFEQRRLLREWLALQGLPQGKIDSMKAETMVKCYNSPAYMAAVNRAVLRKQRRAQGLPVGHHPTLATPSMTEEDVRRIAKEVIEENEVDGDENGNGDARVLELIRQHTAPRIIELRTPQAKPVKLAEYTHPVFERVLRLTNQGANILLVGPAGCGKTHLGEQIARMLKLDYGAIHGTAGASESALTGWLLPGKGGSFEYTPAPFVTLFEDGDSLFLLDEMDAFDPNMLLIINGALANGHLHIAHRKNRPIVKKGKNVHIIATANTYGTGANPMYAGRSSLDNATLDRFLVVTVDYDEALERKLGFEASLTELEMNDIWQLRKRVRESQLRRVISTRAFQKAGMMKAAGDHWKTTMATLTEGWSRDEKSKVGVQ